MSSSQDPAVTDKAGTAQQLLRRLFVKHHLPERCGGKKPLAGLNGSWCHAESAELAVSRKQYSAILVKQCK